MEMEGKFMISTIYKEDHPLLFLFHFVWMKEKEEERKIKVWKEREKGRKDEIKIGMKSKGNFIFSTDGRRKSINITHQPNENAWNIREKEERREEEEKKQ